MTATNAPDDRDPILAAWLDEGPTDLPDVTRRAILTALTTTPQARRGPLAPWRSTHMTMFARGAAVLVVAFVAIGIGALLIGPRNGVGGPTPTATPTSTPTPTTTPAPTPLVFTSAPYRYSITLPTGWVATPAHATWDGTTAPIFDDPVVDAFGPAGDVGAFVSAAPTSSSLSAWVADGIATNARDHTVDSGCSNFATPDSVESITIGGQPGTLVGFKDCFFVNMAFTVVNGHGYRFAFRDPVTMDSSLITTMLGSVVFH
ncbi:MAG TPA: hypothetical protein VGQ31_05035 [Candidatus Limnocylindrales bacterium]|jgi:hypothetical protein|nr:hypothetical protein [Candidatus Limnocylindrales bacterium]